MTIGCLFLYQKKTPDLIRPFNKLNMSVTSHPQNIKYFVISHPLDKEFGLKLFVCCRIWRNYLIQISNPLDTALEKLWLETFLTKFKSKNLLVFFRFLFVHNSGLETSHCF